jgi:hypothetical protein
MIPIKNPNISTNRYKELLRIEKYYHKLQKEDSELIEEYKDRIDKLYDKIGILEEKVINAIEYVEESYDVTVEGIEGVADFFSKRNETLIKILKGSDK